MKGYTLTLTRKADKDEAEIYAYITKQFGDMYAEQFRARFIEFCNVLSKQPLSGEQHRMIQALKFLF